MPDYVERVLAVGRTRPRGRERQARLARAPLRRQARAVGRGKTDIYLEELGGALFGYAAPDRGQTPKGHRLPRRLHGYLVLDNDYDPSRVPGHQPQADLEVTFAHEYCHILQFGYDAYQDAWFAESTAVWMEDQVYDGIDDYLRYVRRWVQLYRTPLTANSIKEYGSAVWNDWLAHRYGRAILRNAWARALHTKPGGFSVSALRLGDPRRRAARTSAATSPASPATSPSGAPATRLPRGPLATPTCRARAACLATAARCSARSTTPPSSCCASTPAAGARSSPAPIAPRGRRRRPGAGRADRQRAPAAGSSRGCASGDGGGRMTVRLRRPGRFQRITAVVINADTSAEGFNARRLDWNYLTDTAPFRVRRGLVR